MFAGMGVGMGMKGLVRCLFVCFLVQSIHKKQGDHDILEYATVVIRKKEVHMFLEYSTSRFIIASHQTHRVHILTPPNPRR